jgi:hypothetical protein
LEGKGTELEIVILSTDVDARVLVDLAEVKKPLHSATAVVENGLQWEKG